MELKIKFQKPAVFPSRFVDSSSPKRIYIQLHQKKEKIILHAENLLEHSFWLIRNEVIIPFNIIFYLFFSAAENRGGGVV